MKIVFCSPSYRRPNGVEVDRFIPSVALYVAESEVEEYRKYNEKVHIRVIPDSVQGNLSRVRNYILEDQKENIVVMVDDDLQYVGYHENRALRKLNSEEELIDFVYKYSILAMDWGVKMWGVQVNPDKQNYREYSPFSTLSYIGDPFTVHINDPLRYDERFRLKMDYDFAIQHLNRFRKILRVNKFFYQVRQMEQVGGCSMYRNIDEEKKELKMLQSKWGRKIIKEESVNQSRSHSSKKKRTFDVNPILKVPISGI